MFILPSREPMNFDILAPYYRGMERLLAGGKLHRCRIAFLDQIPPPQKILLLGEGHGRGLVEWSRQFPNARITCVDASAGMLAQARHELVRHDLSMVPVEFVHADILNWSPPSKTYDLVVTNFFLDCFRPEELAHIIPKIAGSLTPDANWLLADFKVPPTGPRRVRARFILWTMYAFFRSLTGLSAHQLTPPDLLLIRAGFTLHRRFESEWGLLHSDWWRQKPSKTNILSQLVSDLTSAISGAPFQL